MNANTEEPNDTIEISGREIGDLIQQTILKETQEVFDPEEMVINLIDSVKTEEGLRIVLERLTQKNLEKLAEWDDLNDEAGAVIVNILVERWKLYTRDYYLAIARNAGTDGVVYAAFKQIKLVDALQFVTAGEEVVEGGLPQMALEHCIYGLESRSVETESDSNEDERDRDQLYRKLVSLIDSTSYELAIRAVEAIGHCWDQDDMMWLLERLLVYLMDQTDPTEGAVKVFCAITTEISKAYYELGEYKEARKVYTTVVSSNEHHLNSYKICLFENACNEMLFELVKQDISNAELVRTVLDHLQECRGVEKNSIWAEIKPLLKEFELTRHNINYLLGFIPEGDPSQTEEHELIREAKDLYVINGALARLKSSESNIVLLEGYCEDSSWADVVIGVVKKKIDEMKITLK
jgi:tetratricopeptide (TPR) repeat protein